MLPKTNGLVVEQIEGVLEGATQQINQNVQHTTVSMKYIEDEVQNSEGKSKKWVNCVRFFRIKSLPSRTIEGIIFFISVCRNNELSKQLTVGT